MKGLYDVEGKEYDRRRDMYQWFREQVRHEDDLINQRMTWVLTSEGFLLVAYSAVTGLSGNGMSFGKQLVCVLISVLGMVLSLTGFLGILGAIRSLAFFHSEAIADNKLDRVKYKVDLRLPPISGAKPAKIGRIDTNFAIGAVPIVWFFVWICLALAPYFM